MENNIITIPMLNISKQYFINTKIADIISTQAIPIDGNAIKIITNGKKQTLVDVILTYDIPVAAPPTINALDAAVMDAVYTISLQSSVFTAEQVVRVLTGNPAKKVTPLEIQRCEASIDKLIATKISLNCENEARERGYKQTHLSGALIPAKKYVGMGRFQSNFKTSEVTAYTLMETPVLYKHAELTSQIICADNNLLHVQGVNGIKASIIERYVIRRVYQIKSGHMNNSRISYYWEHKADKDKNRNKGMFEKLGIDYKHQTAKQKQQINKIVVKTLNQCKINGMINDYQPYRAGNSNNPAKPVLGYIIS